MVQFRDRENRCDLLVYAELFILIRSKLTGNSSRKEGSKEAGNDEGRERVDSNRVTS
jgi:hypothetical protein